MIVAIANRLVPGAMLDPVRRIRVRVGKQIKRRFGRVDRELAERYLRGEGVPKLHLGCGSHKLRGWLNTDRDPGDLQTMYLDATRPFPFASNTFDFVFTEHMIEHVTYEAGLAMLGECHRVLKASGVARISTPDLAFLIDMARSERSQTQEDYLRWSARIFAPGRPDEATSAFLINRFVREWNLTFIYDDCALRQAMRKAGFTSVEKCQLLESRHEPLRNLENEERLPPQFLRLETLTVEGTK